MVKKIPPRAVRKIKEESKELQKEVRKRMATYIAAALGLVVGLAWNEAIKAVIEQLFPLDKNTMTAKLIYAGVVTFILVVVTAYILREPKEKEEKK